MLSFRRGIDERLRPRPRPTRRTRTRSIERGRDPGGVLRGALRRDAVVLVGGAQVAVLLDRGGGRGGNATLHLRGAGRAPFLERHQELAGLAALVRTDDLAIAHHVDEARGARVADAELALEHRGGA